MNELASLLGTFVAIILVILFLKGAIKTFRRHWFFALALLLVVPPAWAVWSLVEVFTGEIPAGRSSEGEHTNRKPRTSVGKTAVATGAATIGGFAVGRKIGKKIM